MQRIGDWHLDRGMNEIRRGDGSVRLEPKAIEVLAYLARHPGRVVGREELLSAVWPGMVVGDDALTQAIIKLRRALGDEARTPRYIETISKRGYRLIAPVGEAGGAPSATAAPTIRWRRVLPALAGALVVVAAVALFSLRDAQWGWPIGVDRKAGAVDVQPPVIAVLPLSNLGGDPQRDYLGDGVTEELIAALGRFSALRVISRNSVEQYREKAPPPKALREALGARYILLGSVRESSDRIRVSVELSDADRGLVLWSDGYEGPGHSVFEIQDRIVKNIVGALAVRVTRLEEERVARTPPESLEAYHLVLRARALLRRSERDANRQARELLARALALAPGYAEADLELARAELHRALYGWVEDGNETLTRAEQLLLRALASGDAGSNARAHGLLGHLYTVRGRYEQALAEADLAIALNPSDSFVHEFQGTALMYMGRIGEGIAALESALHLDPAGNSSGTRFHLALAHYALGRYVRALRICEENIARYPEAPFSHALRAGILVEMGRDEEARKSAIEARRLEPFLRVDIYGTRFRDPGVGRRLQEALRKAGL